MGKAYRTPCTALIKKTMEGYCSVKYYCDTENQDNNHIRVILRYGTCCCCCCLPYSNVRNVHEYLTYVKSRVLRTEERFGKLTYRLTSYEHLRYYLALASILSRDKSDIVSDSKSFNVINNNNGSYCRDQGMAVSLLRYKYP